MLLGFPVMDLVVHERHEKARKKRFRIGFVIVPTLRVGMLSVTLQRYDSPVNNAGALSYEFLRGASLPLS